ncbi:hypothetical protein Gogos_017690 [Gossypium gossypioides]|uniref:Importin subunit alpha n=1 Tax=Gossypium gossypioides TaxID=34282 RepID=A0A7J9BBL2_GOSGO|nr:hypothetical protein [Gossypium gossypioides]
MKWLYKFDKDKWQKRQRQMQKNLRSMESIRKINRELILFFKRNHEFFHVERCIEDAAGDPIAIQKMFDSIPVTASDLMSGNESSQFAATARLSFLLSTENPPIDVVIQSGVVPHFVRFLNEHYGLQHKLYSVRALYAIGKGSLEQAVVVIKHGAIPMFIRLLCCSEECYQLKELVAAALGSLANQSPDFRDYVLQFGTLTPLLSLLDNHLEPPMLHEKITLLRACSNTLAIFCQGNSAPSFNQIRSALPILRRLIHLNPPVGVIGEVCEDACLCLSYLSNGSAEQIQALIDADVCARLVMLLGLSDGKIVEHVLRTVGNIFKGVDSQIQILINNGVFFRLNAILMHGSNSSVLRKTCSAISTLTARDRNQIQKIMDAHIIPSLLYLSQADNYDVEVRWDAACALSNAARRGSNEQIRFLVNQGCIGPLCDHILCPDRKTSILCLKGLKSVLKAGEIMYSTRNLYTLIITDFDGFGKIEKLQSDPDIGEMAMKLLMKYGV